MAVENASPVDDRGAHAINDRGATQLGLKEKGPSGKRFGGKAVLAAPAEMQSAEETERRAWFRREVLPLRPGLHQYVRRILMNDAEVEDIVHETLVKVMSVADWRRVASPSAFLKTVARNLMLDMFRRRNIVPIHLVADMGTMIVIDETANPEATWIGREELRLLAQLVAALPPQCQRVFTLRKIYGMSPPDIAAELGLSLSTVEKHLLKALRFCADGLAREEVCQPNFRTYGSRWRNKSGKVQA